MAIEIIEHSPFCIVKIVDSLSIENAIAIQKELENIFVTNVTLGEIVLDLSNVQSVDFSGIGGVIAALFFARAKGITVILYRPTKHIQEIMGKMQMNNLFPLILSEEELIIHALTS